MYVLTGGFELPKVDVDQHKVDDGGAILFPLFWFEDVAFFQALSVKNFGVDLGKGKFVHPSPLLCKQKFLECKFKKLKNVSSTCVIITTS